MTTDKSFATTGSARPLRVLGLGPGAGAAAGGHEPEVARTPAARCGVSTAQEDAAANRSALLHSDRIASRQRDSEVPSFRPTVSSRSAHALSRRGNGGECE